MKHNIIFLDFDGVLRPELRYDTNDPKTCPFYELHPTNIEHWNNIVDNIDNLKIVVSSSWRHVDVDFIENYFSDLGLNNPTGLQFVSAVLKKFNAKGDIIGITPSGFSISGNKRYLEVQSWIDKNKETVLQYLCIDDIGYMFDGKTNLYITISDRGILEDDVNQIIGFFHGENVPDTVLREATKDNSGFTRPTITRRTRTI